MYKQLWRDDRGQDIAEYALMLAILLTIVVAVLQTIGKNETALFSQVASKLAAAM
jgi:Flp pilus assembly pilin Flp